MGWLLRNLTWRWRQFVIRGALCNWHATAQLQLAKLLSYQHHQIDINMKITLSSRRVTSTAHGQHLLLKNAVGCSIRTPPMKKCLFATNFNSLIDCKSRGSNKLYKLFIKSIKYIIKLRDTLILVIFLI